MLDKLLSPFIGYWYWAQDRATPLTKALALGAPLVVFGLMLYLLFGRSGDDASSLTPELASTQGNIAAGTAPPVTMATEPPTTGAQATEGQSTGGQPTGAVQPTAVGGATGTSATTGAAGPTGVTGPTGPAPTAFAQQRYTVASGDTPGAIAEKVGVPNDIRADWIQEMLALNGVTATSLQVGQELILPPF